MPVSVKGAVGQMKDPLRHRRERSLVLSCGKASVSLCLR